MEAKRDQELGEIVDSILRSYRRHGELSHIDDGNFPSREVIWGIVEDLLRILFPGFLDITTASYEASKVAANRVRTVEALLSDQIAKGLRLRKEPPVDEQRNREARAATLKLLREIPAIRTALALDTEAFYDGDPAAQSNEEIIVAYPGLQAIAVYRLAHLLYTDRIPLVPRVMTEYAHSRTGIDIHPGATIGKRFFIDHGTGVVIGETCTIGDNVKIYQGVTLGARSFQKDDSGRVIKGIKRHPDIEDDVTIYSGATILGAVRIERGSIIGGNVWLTRSVPPQTRIMVRPPQQIHMDEAAEDYQI